MYGKERNRVLPRELHSISFRRHRFIWCDFCDDGGESLPARGQQDYLFCPSRSRAHIRNRQVKFTQARLLLKRGCHQTHTRKLTLPRIINQNDMDKNKIALRIAKITILFIVLLLMVVGTRMVANENWWGILLQIPNMAVISYALDKYFG